MGHEGFGSTRTRRTSSASRASGLPSGPGAVCSTEAACLCTAADRGGSRRARGEGLGSPLWVCVGPASGQGTGLRVYSKAGRMGSKAAPSVCRPSIPTTRMAGGSAPQTLLQFGDVLSGGGWPASRTPPLSLSCRTGSTLSSCSLATSSCLTCPLTLPFWPRACSSVKWVQCLCGGAALGLRQDQGRLHLTRTQRPGSTAGWLSFLSAL